MAGGEGLDPGKTDEIVELGFGGEAGLEGAAVAVGAEGREGLLHGAVGREEQERVIYAPPSSADSTTTRRSPPSTCAPAATRTSRTRPAATAVT